MLNQLIYVIAVDENTLNSHILKKKNFFLKVFSQKWGKKTAQPLQVTLSIKHEILIRDILYFLVKHTPIMFVYNFELLLFF